MSETIINKVAQEVEEAQDNCIQIAPFTSRLEQFSISDAYKVADIIHKRRTEAGYTPVGRKLGFTNKEMWSVYGVCEPIWSYVYDKTVRQLSDGQGRCHIRNYAEPKIEPEIVLHFSASPPVDASPLELLECIDWIAHGIEIVQSHYPGWEFKAQDTIADRALHAELFTGEPLPVRQINQDLVKALEEFRLDLFCNSDLCEQGVGRNVLGSPLKAVSYLITILSDFSGLSDQIQAAPVQAGELITTGTLTTACPVRAGQLWSTSIEGIPLPGMSLRIEN